MKKISFSAICKALEDFELPDCQLVVGIADGGIIPAALVASRIGCDLRIVRFNYRNEDNLPRYRQPRLLNTTTLPANADNILLVDDVAVSTKTLNAARRLFKGRKIKTMVFVGEADYVLLPQIHNCVRWPWKL